MQKVILLTVTHFNNTPQVERFLHHVTQLELPGDWRLEVVITDNSGNLDLSLKSGGIVSVCRPESNLGYLRGCSYALETWMQKHNTLPEWIFVSNTDVEFDKEFFTRLTVFPLPERVCCLAPDIILKNGLHQNPHKIYRPGRFEMYSYTLIYRSRHLTAFLDNLYNIISIVSRFIRMKNREISRPEQYKSQYFELIYAPHGSCIILHKTFLEHGGKIDYKGFMYGEEIYIGEEALKQNFKILWVPDLKVTHFKKATTGMVRHVQKVRWRLEISKILWNEFFSKR